MLTNSGISRGLIKLCSAVVMCGGIAASHAQEGLPQGVIVKYRDLNPGQAVRAHSAQVMADTVARFGVELTEVRQMTNGAQVLQIDSHMADADIKQLLANLSADPNVEFAEEDPVVQIAFTPNDPRYNEQWHYYDTVAGVNAPAAWDLATGKGVYAAVIDTGYRPHVDLVQNIAGGYDFVTNLVMSNDGDARDSSALDPGDGYVPECTQIPGARALPASWHGTHTAGTVAAKTNNGVGVAGVAFDAKVVPLRAIGRCGGRMSDISDAVAWAAGAPVAGAPANPFPAKVLNLSLGTYGECPKTLQQSIDVARARGAAVVVAAGNASVDVAETFPGSCNGVIVVAATEKSGAAASYTNFGAGVDVSAPGGDLFGGGVGDKMVLSTHNDGHDTPGADSYYHNEGTSMAAPHVTGVVALMFSVKPTLTPDQVESILKRTARAFPQPCNQCGAGIVDAAAAVAAAKALP